jgi:hypothetical protein
MVRKVNVLVEHTSATSFTTVRLKVRLILVEGQLTVAGLATTPTSMMSSSTTASGLSIKMKFLLLRVDWVRRPAWIVRDKVIGETPCKGLVSHCGKIRDRPLKLVGGHAGDGGF